MPETIKRLTLLLTLALLQPARAETLDCVVEGAGDRLTRSDELNADEQVIMDLESNACRSILAGEIDTMIDAIIADKGLLFADRGGIVVGPDAQRSMFKAFLEAGYRIEFQPTDAFVSASKDMAWAYGLYRLEMPDGSEDKGKYVSVWIMENGAWKNVAEMRNSNGQ